MLNKFALPILAVFFGLSIAFSLEEYSIRYNAAHATVIKPVATFNAIPDVPQPKPYVVRAVSHSTPHSCQPVYRHCYRPQYSRCGYNRCGGYYCGPLCRTVNFFHHVRPIRRTIGWFAYHRPVRSFIGGVLFGFRR